MCVAMLPMSAFAAGIDAPNVDSATIADTQSVSDANGNLYLTVPTSLQLANKTFELTTSEKVSFVATSETAAGQLYASDGMTLFGLQARGRGGIAGKILESGNVTNCWYSYDGDEGPAGEIIDGTEDNNVSTSDSAWSWMSWAANQTVWTVSGQSASFIPEAIEYSFGA